jgi:hypothetical protein
MEFKLSGAQSLVLVAGLPFSINFTVTARLRGPLTLEQLQSALERLRLRHPFIAVRGVAAQAGEAAYFTTEGVPPTPVRVVERVTDEDWVREVEHEITTPFDYHTGPLFRCTWLRSAKLSDLLLVCDHVTADGRSGIFALHDLLRLLANPGLHLEPLLPPRLAELVPPPMVALIRKITDAAPGEPPTTPADFMDAYGPSPDPLRVIPIALSEAETAAFVARCRAEGVTVQAALCAAFLVPFAEQQPSEPVRRVESPVDIRGRLTQPVGPVYGGYLSIVVTSVDCSPGRGLWDMARDASQGLAAITEEQLFTSPSVMLAVADHPPRGQPFKVRYDLSISNLGRLDLPAEYGPLHLESVYAPTFNASLPEHRILGVTTFGGQMRCTFTTRDPGGPQIVRRARELMAAMIQPAA